MNIDINGKITLEQDPYDFIKEQIKRGEEEAKEEMRKAGLLWK